MIDRSLLETPIHLWTYALIDQFLSFGRAEDETIEYKGDLTQREQFADTLGSMSNGDGGWIFVGVSEDSATKKPKRWPLLAKERDHTRDVFNLATAYIAPLIQPRVVALVEPTEGKQILAVRVDSGDDPPYVVRDRGVKVRVGDQDRFADRRTLDRLFSRRESLGVTRARLQQRFKELLDTAASGNNVRLRLVVAPLIEITPVRLGDRATEVIRGAISQRLRSDALSESRSYTGISIRGASGAAGVALTTTGELSAWYAIHDDQWPDAVPIERIWQYVYDTMHLAEVIYPGICGFSGALYIGAMLGPLGNRDISWPPGSRLPPRRTVEPNAYWCDDGIQFVIGEDPIPCTRELVKSLIWQVGYEGGDDILDQLGRAKERS